MAESRPESKQVPSNRELALKVRDSVALSPTDIRPGQVALIGNSGAVWGRRRFVRTVRLVKVGIYGALVGGAVLFLSGFAVTGALLYATGVAPGLWWKYRGVATLSAIDTLLRQGDLDEGQRRLEQAAALRKRNPVGYAILAGKIASHRGEFADAIRWWREALPRLKGIGRELVKCWLVSAHARSGDVVEARRVLAGVSFPDGADELLTLTGPIHCQLVIALHANEIPSTEQLHDWARMTLAYSHTGVDLAALGWAFERCGEEEMASFLATEAPSRMHYPYLKTWWPELQHWLDARLAKAAEGPSPYDV